MALGRAPLRRRRRVLDRGAGADQGAGAARRRRRRLYRHGARHGLRQARSEGDGGRGAAKDPAALRRGADPAGRSARRRSRHRPHARRAGERLRQGRPPRRRLRRRRDVGPGGQGFGRGRAAAAHARLWPRTARFGHGRAVRADRRPLRDLDAQRLGGRRRDRRADAGSPRHGAGRDGRRDHRRKRGARSTSGRSPRSASPTRRSSPSAFRPRRRGRRIPTFWPAFSRSAPTGER